MFVICCGMYRSGSTWQYQVASHLIEQHRGGRRLGFFGPEAIRQYEAASDTDCCSVKLHDWMPEFSRELESGKARGVYAYRDLRDVVYSLMHKARIGFYEMVYGGRIDKVKENHERWMSAPAMLIQRYEEITAEPERSVVEIANQLGIDVGTDEAAVIAEEYSLSRNIKRCLDFASELEHSGVDLADPFSSRLSTRDELHWNHIRHGRTGSWKETADREHLPHLAQLCAEWLIRYGYEPDAAWSESPQVSQELSPIRT